MRILAIDPGSTTTKIGIFREDHLIKQTMTHPREVLRKYARVSDQFPYRLKEIEEFLIKEKAAAVVFDAIVGRGGLIRPLEGGIYRVNEAMIGDLTAGVNGQHAANLGGLLAHSFSARFHCPAYVVDPPVMDELWPVARVSGFNEIERVSLFHALNQKAAGRSVAQELGKSYQDCRLIVAHMGGGITVGAHCKGKVVDVNNGLNGDGPFSPERTGSLPLGGVLQLLKEDRYNVSELQEIVSRRGGIFSYLGTVEIREVENQIHKGDKKAQLILEAMIYQIPDCQGNRCHGRGFRGGSRRHCPDGRNRPQRIYHRATPSQNQVYRPDLYQAGRI
jgi:butyrate kinase